MPFETILLLLLLVPASTPEAPSDVRVALVEKQLEGDGEAALALLDAALEVDGTRARSLGFDYLRGHLLLEAGRRSEALEAFALTLSATPDLAPWGRLHLARAQAEAGDAEVAAGLVATLLGQKPPRSLVSEAVSLLEQTIVEGGDCRLLNGLGRLRLVDGDRRLLDLARAQCRHRGGEVVEQRRILLGLIDENAGDEVARRAAEQLVADLDEAAASFDDLAAVGMALYQHREFERSVRYLARALVLAPAAGRAGQSRTGQNRAAQQSRAQLYELRYALARSYFWLRRWQAAARSFASLAADTEDASRRAQALYQRARSLELEGETRWPEASAAFQASYSAESTGSWAAASLIARLRLAWLRGDREAALAALKELRRGRKLTQVSSALLFLASSEISAGQAGGVAAWLAEARRLRRSPPIEIDYWQGRLAELDGRLDDAAGAYVAVARSDRFHPFGQSAMKRLGSARLVGPARRLGRSLVGSAEPAALYGAWLALGPEQPLGRAAVIALRKRLVVDPRAAAFLGLDMRPTAQWPLWSARLSSPEEKLLALGLFEESSSRVLRHFPVTDPSLAFTGSSVLAQAGVTRRSLYIAEIMAKRKPHSVPLELLPEAYRQLLYPFRYSYLILKESQKRQVDPYLLAAIIREESRFDPQAFSAAAARGLTQFIVPTARSIGERIDLEPIEPADLHRPEISIALGAGYLQELSNRFKGDVPSAVAAYNAGEPQAELWRKYCVSEEPEEYLTKVAFRETRNYVRKVLRSRAHYEDLYRPRE